MFLIPSQKLYTVCDVAMNIIMSKSTTYSLESPKDPVLPARFFTQPDKVIILERVYIDIKYILSITLWEDVEGSLPRVDPYECHEKLAISLKNVKKTKWPNWSMQD